MGTIQVPGRLSGRTYTVNIKGDSPSETEQARIRAIVEEREARFIQKYEAQFGQPAPTPDDGTALGRGFARGVPQVKSTIGTTLETVGQQLGLAGLAEYGRGMEEAAARRLFDLSLQQPAPTTREDVAAAEGIFPTIGKALTFAGELAGEQAPQLGVGLAGGAAGAVGGGLAAGPVGALVGFGVGSGLTEVPLLFGANVQRQEEEVAAGRKEAVDLTDALGATIGQAALTSVTNALAGAGVFVRPGARLFTRVASGAAVGGTTEGLNEIGQQMLERYQAGLPVDSPDAIKEYIDAGVAGGILGLGAGGLGGAIAGRRPQEEVPPTTLSLPTPTKPGPAKIQSVTRRGPRVGPATTTTVRLDDGATLTLQGDATEADIARAVDQHNQTKVAVKAPVAPKAPTPKVEDIPEAEIVSDDGRPTGGVSIDEDLAEARAVYDERLAIAEEGGTDPEEAKRIAAQAAVNYVDSLQEDARKRLARFRNTMARLSVGPTRGVMQPDIPDEAYASEFGEVVQKDLFAPSPATPKVAERPTLQTWETLKPGDKVTLYRGENQDNTQGGDWWTTNPEKAAQYGSVRSFTADAVDVGRVAVQGHGGTDEFYFPNGVPEKFLSAETRPAAPKAEAPVVEAPRVAAVKPAQVLTEETVDRLGVGKAKSARLRKLVGTPLTDTKVIQALNSWAQNDRATPENKALAARLITGQPEPEITPAPEVQDDATTAEAQPEAVGVGIEDGGRGVELGGQPADDIQPAEGVEAPAEGGLGGGMSVPVGADTAARAEPDTLIESGLPADPDKPSLPDTRGMGVRFHGSTSEITQVEDGYVGSDRNFYGQGFYTSDAVAITDGYSKAKGAKDGAVYRVDEIGPVNALDMEQPVPDWLISDYEAGRSQAALNDDLVAAAIEDMQAEGKALNLREFYDLIRDMSPEFNLPTYEVQEYFDSLSQIIMARGFNALDHIGGLRTKKAPHSVRIYLAPQNTVRITKVDPKNPDMAPSVEMPTADTAAGAALDTLSQLEEQLAAARARAAELRKKIPAGILQRELVGGKIDPRLPKQVENLQNVLARQQKAADTARDAVPKKPTHPARPKKLAQYEAALAKVKDTQEKLAAAQDALGTAELAAGLQRGAQPKAPMNEKAKSAYTAYFNALQDADTLRKTLESERARSAVAPEQPAQLPSLRGDILPELNVVYPAGGTRGLGQAVPSLRDPVIAEAPLTMLGQRKVLPPAEMVDKVANDVRKEGILRRLVQFFLYGASDALKNYTMLPNGINHPDYWKSTPDWVPLDDQFAVLQLLGKYDVLAEARVAKANLLSLEVPLTTEERAARVYFGKTVRPVDAIDMMLDDLSVDYEIYEGPANVNAAAVADRDLKLGTGSRTAKNALNWVRANLSPETNAEIDLLLKKQADENEVMDNFIEADSARIALRKAAKEARAKANAEAQAKAAEDSGYDAMSIVRKMVAGDSRVALDQEMHYSVKAALNAGDLKGALQALADTTSNLELKDMASRFAGLVGTTRVRVLYPGDSAKYIGNDRGTYVLARPNVEPEYRNTILINGQTGMTNHVLMHEMAHALSSRFIDENPNHPVVKQLRDLLSALREVGPKQQLFSTGRGTARVAYPTDFYGLTDISEMVAEGYGRLALGETDNGLRDLMKRTTLRDPVDRQVEYENPLNAWDRFKELIGNILNVIMRKPLTRRPRTKRIETVQVYETAADRFHRLVDGLLSEAPQVLPESVLQAAVTKPMVAINVLNNAVNNASVWSPEGMSRLAQLMTTAIPQPLRRALLGLLQLDWFNDFAGKYFPQIAKLKEIDDLRRGKYQAFNKGVQGVLQDLLAFAQKSPELYNALMSIQGQATLAGVDPTRPVSDYAGDKEKTDEWYNLDRQLTSPEMRKLFKQTRNVFRQFRDEIKRVLKARALDITNDEAKANNLVAQLLKKLDEENAIDPYFALMRTGDFWLKYTAEDTTAAPVAVGPLGQMKRPTVEYVQAFTDPFARDRFRAKLEAARDADGNPIAWNITSMPRPTGDFVGGAPPSVAFAQGALNIISSFGGAGTSTEEQQKVKDATNAIQELFVRLTPDHSAMKAFIKRKGTRGFMGDITPLGVVETPTDFITALARKADGLAYQLINIEYGGKIQKLIDDATETRSELVAQGGLTEPEQSALTAYYEEFVERAQLAKAPRVGAFGQFLRGVTFGWTLGFNVAGFLNNLVQIPMVGMTELAGRYGGLGNAKRELGFAMRVLKNAGKSERVISFGPDGREIRELSGVDNYGSFGNYFEPVITVDPNTGQEVITSRLRTDMKIPEALRNKLANMDVLAEVMANHGMLNASMSQELLEAEAGWLHKINRWSGFLQHHAERFNRQSMAIAAYNLELGKLDGPATPAAKLAAAMKAIEITERVNGTIGAATAPRYAMSSFGSVVFMFKRFALHMTRYIVNALKQARKKIDPSMSAAQIEEAKKERAVARYQIIGMLGTTALFAGVQGIPFFSEVMTLINLFLTDDDEERPEVIVQKFLGEPYYHGALNYLLGIDVASRISMSGLIFRENKIEKDQSIMYDAIEMFGGPAVGVFQNIERGVNLINDGEFYRGVEAMSPAAIKSILKAFRFSTDGATTLRGDEVVPVTYADIIKQVLGYTPVDLARTQERVSGAKRIDEAIRNRKRRLLKRYNTAAVDGDFVEVRDVLQEMQEFSRQYPEEAITPDTINRSHRSFLQRSAEMISGVSFTNRERGQAYVDEFDEDTTVWGSQ